MDGNNVLVIAEVRNGTILPGTFEALGKGKELAAGSGGSLDCLLVSEEPGGLPAELFQRGADRVIAVSGGGVDEYRFQVCVRVAADVARRHQARLVLLSSSFRGKELAGGLAAALDLGLATEVTEVESDAQGFRITRAVFGGNRLARLTCGEPSVVLAFRAKAFPEAASEPGRTGELIEETIEIEPAETEAVRGLGAATEAGDGEVDLAGAEIIVSGGRGLGKAENFSVVRELADVVGGAVGASRAVVDAGWIPYAHQVGQTGRTVTPRLYIACGISGAIQHLAGMRTSEVIVAINKDADAPIFKVATYGIVGDLFQVVPKLTEKLRGRLAAR